MKKKLLFTLCLTAVLAFSGCGSDTKGTSTTSTDQEVSDAPETTAQQTGTKVEETNIFAQQGDVEQSLLNEAKSGNYTFEEPFVTVNPYGNSPLTAVVIFTTQEETGGTITVKGKEEADNITGTFKAAKEHIVPVYGLYADDTTKVELKLDDGTTNEIEVTTEALDVTLSDADVTVTDENSYDYSQLTLVCASGGGIYAMDSKADVRWYFADGGSLGIKQLKNGHLLLPAQYTLHPTYYKEGLIEIDYSGKIYHEYGVPGGMHHEVMELENGNFLVASDTQDFTSVEDVIVEIDAETGEVVWELDMKDILDKNDGASATRITDNATENTLDWFHNNSFDYNEKTDTVAISGRHLDAVVGVNKTTKKVEWILGDPTGWKTTDKTLFFTPQGDDFEWQYGQHEVTYLDNGDIMLFDNGSGKVKYDDNADRVKGDDVYSRAVAYSIDTENMTIEQVFEYGKERGAEWYSDWMSGVYSLDGTTSNVWITSGTHLYSQKEDSCDFGPTGMFTKGLKFSTIIDQVKDNNLVYEVVLSGDSYTSLTFRSLRISMYTEEGNLDIAGNAGTAGTYLGTIGESKTNDKAQVNIQDAKTTDTCAVTLDPLKLTLNTTYNIESADKLTDSYIVLKDSAGKEYVYDLAQTTADAEDGTCDVTVTGWVSRDGLESGKYDIYAVIGENAYNTGYYIEN